jgi:hypothetical protein
MDALDIKLTEVMAALRRRLDAAVGNMRSSRDPAAFCEAERVLVELAQGLASDVTMMVVDELSRDKDRRRAALDEVRRRAEARGIEMRIERDRSTEFQTLGGKTVTVTTPYATARPRGVAPHGTRGTQGTGVYPLLDMLGIAGRSTPALRLRVGHAVSEANSVSAARELLAEGGILVDHKAALRHTYRVADDALRGRAEAVRTTTTNAETGPLVGRRVVAAVDGGRVNIRRRVAGRPKNGGRKHFVTEWREPKVVTIYVVGEDGKRDRTIPSVIDGTLGDADAVFELLTYHLLRLGAGGASELVLVGDGAPWIWARGQALRERLGLPPERFIEIIDYFHVVERLTEVAASRAKWTDAERTEWLKTHKEHLKAGRIEHIEAAIRASYRRRSKDLKTEIDYWERNRERLRYGGWRARGIPIGSGAVESSVRRVVNLRMKGASVTWLEEHAEGVLHLRAFAKSGRWGELERMVLANCRWRPTARGAKRAG